ncbi:MAG: FtsX-like permease family protein [Bacteroidetes bacterium]|nr:FtsX-like permease family protein [Bacteroidota bacterium]
MKTAVKLAIRNLLGAGLRTWLNVFVLSITYVLIIWMQGLMAGWDYQAKRDMADWQIGAGQYWHQAYDPFDPLTLTESHAPVPQVFMKDVEAGNLVPQLLTQATIYPQGRMLPVVLRGLPADQQVLKIPTHLFDTSGFHVVIGGMLARTAGLSEGDVITLRWRDANGTFDAAEVTIAGIFHSNVPAAETAQIYMDLKKLQQMLGLPGEASILVFSGDHQAIDPPEGWVLRTFAWLTREVDEMIRTKTAGQSILFGVLLLLAMLAVFDTQVLSIFRRQREIGTYVALGYTKLQVVGLFTIEGTMYALLAALLSMAYGLPLLAWQAKAGWTLPVDAGDFGMSMAQTLYPVYSAGLVAATVLLVTITTAIVSYLPSRKIARMNPVDALKGKIQ